MRKTLILLLALLFTAAACGSGSDDGDTDTSTTTTATGDTSTTVAETVPETTAAPLTLPPVTNETVAPSTVTTPPDTGGAPAASPVGVNMIEWEVQAPTSITAGTVDFVLTNGGNFSHQLAIARGESYDTLPVLDSGAVDEATLGTDYLGVSDQVDFGGDTTATFDLEPGAYVLYCPIVVGPNSHVAQGQWVSVQVVG